MAVGWQTCRPRQHQQLPRMPKLKRGQQRATQKSLRKIMVTAANPTYAQNKLRTRKQSAPTITNSARALNQTNAFSQMRPGRQNSLITFRPMNHGKQLQARRNQRPPLSLAALRNNPTIWL